LGGVAVVALVLASAAMARGGSLAALASPATVESADGVLDLISPVHAVPARALAIERAGTIELARAWTAPTMVGPLLAVLVLCLVAGSTGLAGAGAGWSATRRGRAPPRRLAFHPVR
jgi:hypothetical protein